MLVKYKMQVANAAVKSRNAARNQLLSYCIYKIHLHGIIFFETWINTTYVIVLQLCFHNEKKLFNSICCSARNVSWHRFSVKKKIHQLQVKELRSRFKGMGCDYACYYLVICSALLSFLNYLAELTQKCSKGTTQTQYYFRTQTVFFKPAKNFDCKVLLKLFFL